VALNLVSNQVGFLLPALITFFLSPFVVHALGDELYGLWSLVVSFSGHYGLLTLGVQSAATRYVAHAAGARDAGTLNRYVNAGFLLLLPAAILACLAGSILALFLEPLFHIRPEDLSPGGLACVLMALTTGVTFATAIFSSILAAFQRFDSLNIVKVSSTIVRSLFTVWLLFEGHGIVALAVLSLVIAAASGLGFAGLARLQCPGWKLSRSAVDRSSVKTLLVFGGKSLVGTAALALIYQTDLFVIGLFLGTEEITMYSLASTLLFYVLQFVNSIVHVLDPYATERFARGGVALVRDLFVEGSAFVYVLGGIVVGSALAFSNSFFAIWIDPEHAAAGTILAILVVPQFFDMGARFGHSFLVGMASIGTFNAVTLAGGVLNLVLSLAFVRIWGIEGVAVGRLIPMVLVNSVWFIPYISRVLGIRASRICRGSVAPGLLVAVVAWGAGSAVQKVVVPAGWGSLAFCCSATLVASALVSWFVLPKRVAGLDWREWGLGFLRARMRQLSARKRHA
jgi:O-antigen/teichoic acid export membrane protein